MDFSGQINSFGGYHQPQDREGAQARRAAVRARADEVIE